MIWNLEEQLENSFLNFFGAKMKDIKTPIEYFIDYLKLHKVDDTYYLMQRQSIHQDFLEVIKRYEQKYINSVKKE